MNRPRIIAFYLPQYYPIPENDAWWGKGFTEWRNVVLAKPLFKGHYEPRIPKDLGFYDLRLPEIREEQAELAKNAGIEGFCYWHYWMGNGRLLLDRPFKDVLASGKPDFPFCLGWANHNWTNKTWVNDSNFHAEKNLIKVLYSEDDYIAHFNYVLKAFKDKRYITVDEKPLFYIWGPNDIPDLETFIDIWQNLAKKNGLKGIYFVGHTHNIANFRNDDGSVRGYDFNSAAEVYNKLLDRGLDSVNSLGFTRAQYKLSGTFFTLAKKIFRRFFRYSSLRKYDYSKIMDNVFVKEDKWNNVFPTVTSSWDRSPRSGKDAVIYHNSTPEKFKKHLLDTFEIVKNKTPQHQIVFLKSWNEWGEGNYVEPDLKYGHAYLDVIKNALNSIK
jgi:hypothetical protein